MACVALFCCSGFALGSDPKAFQEKLAQLKALDEQGKTDQAIPQYRELLRDNPNSSDVRLALANDLARTSNCDDAGLVSREASAAASEAVAGICEFRRHEVPAAITHLSKALQTSPPDRQTAIFLARAYADSGRPDEGVRVLRSLQTSGKSGKDVSYWLGVFYDQLAQQTYDAMAKSYPESPLLFETQGDQLEQQQKYAEALKAFQKARNACTRRARTALRNRRLLLAHGAAQRRCIRT